MHLFYSSHKFRKTIYVAAGFLFCAVQLSGQTIYVSTKGNDKWDGTEKKPVAAFERAQELARAFGRDTSV